ncbi:hypothetical protein GALMADRAFT_535304 [Galerina marginata CBS 339.88]|uniref:Ribonuclease H2 subunit B n=1 Tax=Galerina marginata (strain CBS 339.88) TaxID=685588 RepID=A0A067SW90_GALM3|nr:hypothetical protein GALMADRAFT_535304 [Galerina marginata CBS 339.88]
MNSHFSILPSAIIQYLTSSLNQTEIEEKPLRIFRLPHPRTGFPALFLPLEWLPPSMADSSTLLEIQAVCPPDERSWILGEDIIADGKLFAMTPIDPAFLLLPILQATQAVDGSTAQFRTTDDLFEEAAKKITSPGGPAAQVRDILDFCSLKGTRKALVCLCDMKEISSEIVVYRFSAHKAMEYMRDKVARLQKCPAFDRSRTTIRSLAKDGLLEDGKEDLLQLGRMRACCDLVSQYLSPDIRDQLVDSYDFKKLDTYLNASMEEAITKTGVAPPKVQSKTGSKPVPTDKKRKATAKPSQGVEKLKKVNTTGMAKLSSFFNKA